MGILFTITMGFLFTRVLGIQLTISSFLCHRKTKSSLNMPNLDVMLFFILIFASF